MNQYKISEIEAPSTSNALASIPKKRRNRKPSPLFLKLDAMKIGDGIVIEGATTKDIAANVYNTATRASIVVTLRQLDNGVGVWRIHNTNPKTDAEVTKEQEGMPKRGQKAA